MLLGDWVSYASDFPASWLGSDLIVGSSTGVPIKRGVVEEIGIVTQVGQGQGEEDQEGDQQEI